MTEPEGIDVAAVTAWFVRNVIGVEAPLAFTAIPGGRSNLTYIVDDAAGARWVLRRPPLGEVLATAHDMSREHDVISALRNTDVPVPPIAGICQEAEVTGAPFYVMGYVDGVVARDPATVDAHFPVAVRDRLAGEVVDGLARIHAVGPDSVGLGGLGRREGYIARQLRRWHGQWERSKTRELAAVEEVHDWLAAHVPEQGPACLVHGDYRLDNCLFSPAGELLAVLDWELCTLGDPLADVGLLMVYWSRPGDAVSALLDAPTALDGFPDRGELLERYARRSGRDVSLIDYYVAFGYWKLACILEGVYARWAAGAMGSLGEADEDWRAFEGHVEELAEAARDAVARL
jgi:aminoglycoside phosphotransferase (APT) family kinase protein